MKYWVSLATHGRRIDAPGLRETVDTIIRFEPPPERVIVAVSGIDDYRKARDLLSPWSRSPFLWVIDTGCRGAGKKIWPAMKLREDEGERVAILTVDDDCYYQPDLPSVLFRGAEDHPGCLMAMTVWEIGNVSWTPERGLVTSGMGCITYGRGDGPNGAAGVLYMPDLGLDWRELRRWSFDPRTEMSDDIFIGAECRRRGIPVMAVGGMYRWGIRPLEGCHANDTSALYRAEELNHRALLGFVLGGWLPCPAELRGTECDPDAPRRSEPVFAD